MEIVVRGRNVEVPEHYRQHVEDKVGQLERFDGKLKMLRMDVELFHEKNPRQSANCQRVEITLRGKGPVVRPRPAAPTSTPHSTSPPPNWRTDCAARPTAAGCTTDAAHPPASG